MNFVNWPNPDDHWSDIPLDRLDKWKEWGRTEEHTEVTRGVFKRRVEPQQQTGPRFSQNLGRYQTETGYNQQFQPFNSQPKPPQSASSGSIFPIPQFPSTQVPIYAQNIQQPTQNSYFLPSQPTNEPAKYNSGFFPSNILVQFPDAPIISHPQADKNGMNHPPFIPRTPVNYQDKSNLDRYQDTSFKKPTSKFSQQIVNGIQNSHFKAKAPKFNPSNNIQSFRDPVQIRPFVQFNLKDSVDSRGPEVNVKNQQEPFMNYNSLGEEEPLVPHRRQSPHHFNLEDEMSAPPPPPLGRLTPHSPFGPRPPRIRISRPRQQCWIFCYTFWV